MRTIPGSTMRKISKERRWAQAINTLLRSRSIAAAARKEHVDERTMRRWLDDPDFRAQYQAARKDFLHRGLGNLATKVFDAVQTLAEIAKHRGREFQGARSHAAANIIRLALDADVIENLEERILALERQGRTHEKFSID
jgi:hypothetical protein